MNLRMLLPHNKLHMINIASVLCDCPTIAHSLCTQEYSVLAMDKGLRVFTCQRGFFSGGFASVVSYVGCYWHVIVQRDGTETIKLCFLPDADSDGHTGHVGRISID